jgi:hypothetical protein
VCCHQLAGYLLKRRTPAENTKMGSKRAEPAEARPLLAEKFFLLLETIESRTCGSPRVVGMSRHVPIELPPPNKAPGVAPKHQRGPKLSAGLENALTVQRDGRSVRAGAHDRRCTMRDEFASNSFLAVTVAGLVLLCSGLVALAIT